MKLLVVEDDSKTVQSLQKGLTEEGFVVDVCRDGETGLHLALNAVFDLIILDVMLPAMDGWALLAQARESHCNTPILVLTAKEAIEDRVRGLDLGADDYLVTPFAFVELVARVRSILRRHLTQDPGPLCFADLTVDLRRHKVVRNKVPNRLFREIGVFWVDLHPGGLAVRPDVSDRLGPVHVVECARAHPL